MPEFNHVFECTRVRNDTEKGDVTIGIYTPWQTGYISKNDVIEMAKYFEVTAKDLQGKVQKVEGE